MKSHSIRALLACAATIALAGCGGAGGGGAAFISSPPVTPTPTPSPAPTPTPTPTPPPPPVAPAHLGLVSDKPFAVVASGETYLLSSNNQDRSPVSGPAFQEVQFSYDASSNSYTISLPGFQTGRLANTSYNGSSGQPAIGSFSSVTAGDSTSVQPVGVTLQVPGTHYSPYTYTGFGWWDGQTGTTSSGVTHEEGIFAYGIPTAATGIPVSGNATYSAMVQGRTIDDYYIGGEATLQFAFATGTLSGHFDPAVYDWDALIPLGRYDFTNTVYSLGSTSFSGSLSQAGVGTGSFNGQFTGPNAEELMARWTAPFNNPLTGPTGGEPSTMSGVWIGKKN